MSPLLATLKLLALSLGLFYVGVPIVLYTFPSVLRSFVFLNFLRRPFTNYAAPTRDFGVAGARNFYLEHDDVRLGIWQVSAAHLRDHLPKNDDAVTEDGLLKISQASWEALLSAANTPIILYCHGNAFDRSYPNRRKMYKRLSDGGYTVLAVDYRGFGDSTGTPTEDGTAADIAFVHGWAVSHAGSNPVLLWGHSLGTAIATKATIDLTAAGHTPFGLVLEAPFNKLCDVVSHHPITVPFRRLPYFDTVFVSSLRPGGRAGIAMNTDERLEHVQCPVMILHAHDDRIVPFQLAIELQKSAAAHGTDIELHEFDGEHKYGHNEIHRVPQLNEILKTFVAKCGKRAT